MMKYFENTLKFMITLTIIVIVYTVVKSFIPSYFVGFESFVIAGYDNIASGFLWIYNHSLEIFLVWAGRFSRNFKDNMKSYFSAIVLFSTFRLNLARYKALKSKGSDDV